MSSGMGTAEATWEALLDGMERELSFLTEQLIAGVVTAAPAPFAPPASMPPLPAALARRATYILGRMATVETELQARADEARERLRGLEREQHERRPMRPAFFDQAV